MSQEKPRKEEQEPVKYGDLFVVEGELANKVVAPVDADMMQAAENAIMGGVQKHGVAEAMRSAAKINEAAGIVSPGDVTGAIEDHGISITQTEFSGRRVVSQLIGGQVVEQFSQKSTSPSTGQEVGNAGITIGEALEATAITAGNKPVEWSDAAAIQAAEVRATGRTSIIPGGVAAAAQSAATFNARVARDEEKTKLADVLADATSKLPSDKTATRRDAEGVTGAEMRNDPNLTTHPAGVAASVAAAARINQAK
ncbi:late embryogenesis abundant protein 31-like [Prosopis cineraria]|uniref:late embryogenesis abundant protein 31-like n=1 Tax=Prosopis cineraria TaxID=364024 RepID=UPI00240F7F97|nr:late embryogenesis abundant protein 31-like [Prosopis cineraria]